MKKFFRGLLAVTAVLSVVLFASLTFAIVKKVWFGKSGISHPSQVAVVDLTGMMLSSTSFIRQLDDKLEDKSVKAIVVRINSPGGLVAPSQEMYEAIRRADAKVPVVVSMGSVAASGGYYAALGGRKIFANPGTMTASIGVIMELANTEKLYTWAKVQRFALKAGKFKDVGSPLREMKPEERELMQNLLNDVHAQFKGAVQERRKLEGPALENVTDGRVVTGNQAKAAGLVDALGGYEEAIKEAKVLAGLPETAEVSYPEERSGLLRKILLGEETESSNRFLEFFTQLTALPQNTGWRVMLLAPLAD